MILDLDRFIREERRYWAELEDRLDAIEKDSVQSMGIAELKRFHYLYQRASADLAKIVTFSAERELRGYLESIVGRAFSEIHETRQKPHRLAPIHWFFNTFPATFRRHHRAFWISLMITMLGFAFGGGAISFDPGAKDALMPFPHLRMDPSERVQREQSAEKDRLQGRKATFSSYLMTHNTRVSMLALGLGMTWGIGTILLLFTNGVLLGAVALDYIMAGETRFLLGWLLPHGSIEIPAILLAGQAGLVLAYAVIGWGKPVSLSARLRAVSGDLVTLIIGIAIMLVYAGIVEAFLSQYHEPVIGHDYKIAFGIMELVLLALFLARSGKSPA